MMAPFLVAEPEDSVPVKVFAEYEGAIPPKICDYLTERIIGYAKSGFCYPADPMDVYGDVWQQIEKRARSLPPLEKAAATTYLHKCVDTALRKYFQRRIQPLRAEYRATRGCLEQADAVAAAQASHDAPEGKDVGYATCAAAAESYDYAKGGASNQQLTAQQLSTVLPGETWARERRQQAAFVLDEICEALTRTGRTDATRALRAYVAADGNFVVAAHLAGIGKTKFYQFWKRWLMAAKNIAEKNKLSWN